MLAVVVVSAGVKDAAGLALARDGLTLHLRTDTGATHAVEVDAGASVGDLERAAAAHLHGRGLMFAGAPLDRAALLADLGVGNEAVVDIAVRPLTLDIKCQKLNGKVGDQAIPPTTIQARVWLNAPAGHIQKAAADACIHNVDIITDVSVIFLAPKTENIYSLLSKLDPAKDIQFDDGQPYPNAAAAAKINPVGAPFNIPNAAGALATNIKVTVISGDDTS